MAGRNLGGVLARLRGSAARENGSQEALSGAEESPAFGEHLSGDSLDRSQVEPEANHSRGTRRFVTHIENQRYVLGKADACIRSAIREALQLCRENQLRVIVSRQRLFKR